MTDDDRAVQSWLKRAGNVCGIVATQRREMDAYGSLGAGGADNMGRTATRVWPGLPINVGPIDLMAEIDATAKRYADLTRGTLRLGLSTGAREAGSDLRTISSNISDLWLSDPDLTREVVGVVWGLHRKASRLIDPPTGKRPFRIEEACPTCGLPSLWFDPETWRIACGMPACRSVYGVGEPVLKQPTRS